MFTCTLCLDLKILRSSFRIDAGLRCSIFSSLGHCLVQLNFSLSQPAHTGKHCETQLLYNLVRSPGILPVLSGDPNTAEGEELGEIGGSLSSEAVLGNCMCTH